MKSRRLTATLPLVMVTFVLLAGCESKPKVTVAPAASAAEEVSEADREAEKLKQCRQGLEALQTVKGEHYAKQKSEFDRLMNSAVQYAGVRSRVNNDTQGAIDALYRYRVSRLCAEISQSVLINLADSAEAGK